MTLGQKLKEMRRKMGLSQESLGEIICVSRQAITKWENDTGIPDISNLQELSKIFGTTIDYLLNENNSLPLLKMKLDISKEKDNKESNDEIIRHYYSDDWNIKFVSHSRCYKNKILNFLETGLIAFSNWYGNFWILKMFLYDVDNVNNEYFLLTRDDIKLLCHINNNQLHIIELGDLPIKKDSFIFDDKLFVIKSNTKSNKQMIVKEYIILPLIITTLLVILFAILITLGIIFSK